MSPASRGAPFQRVDPSPPSRDRDRADRRVGDHIEGIPESLPAGEAVLWEGAPDARSLARHVFHLRKIAAYFGVLIVGRAWWARDAADPLADWGSGALVLALLGAAVLGFGGLMAWLVSRTTTYAVTGDRVVMKIGMAFPKVINLPFEEIDGASRKRYRDGTGDIALEPRPDRRRIPFFLLWPHARPWRFSPPQPTLRALPEMATVVPLVGEGLRGSIREESAAGAGAQIPAGPGEPDGRPVRTAAGA